MSTMLVRYQMRTKIQGIRRLHLSLSYYHPPSKKELDQASHTKIGRKVPLEHISDRVEDGTLVDAACPLFVMSCRNVLSNLRSVAYVKGKTEERIRGNRKSVEDRPIGVAEENEVLLRSRPYFVFGMKDGKAAMESLDPKSWGSIKETYTWFISGVPVLWDDFVGDALFRRIVTEASDHSHIWNIPRGSHPAATDSTRAVWRELQGIFQSSLTEPVESASKKMIEFADRNKLEREEYYLHHIIGLDGEGHLCNLVAHGRLEELGVQMKQLGVRRAICIDNSGSITLQLIRKWKKDLPPEEVLNLVAAPNQRLPGTAYLIAELEDSSFDVWR
jgi:hypothetical protein